MCIHAGVCMCLCENNTGKKAINLRGSEECVWEVLEGGDKDRNEIMIVQLKENCLYLLRNCLL